MNLRLIKVAKEFTSARGAIGAVRDITLDIADGEFFVLLGPSGCGKSTLLNLIAGLERLTAGEIHFDGQTVASGAKKRFLSPRERNVAMVFQSYALYPHLTVYDNIAFPLKIAGISKQNLAAGVERAAATLGITELLLSRPGELSGGQRQRVAIARAIVRQPSLFLLDEPLSNLDAQLRLAMRAELKNLQRNLGITTIYVTHDQHEAIALGDRIAVMRAGRLEQVGPPAELYERPSNLFVAGFLGDTQINALPVKLVREGNAVHIEWTSHRWPLPRGMNIPPEVGTEAILAIRPEHIVIGADADVGGIEGRTVAAEPLGRDMLLHVTSQSIMLRILAPRAECPEGEPISFAFDFTRAHLFPQA